MDRQCVDQRFECYRRGADPTGQGRGFQANALAGEDLGLTVQGQVIVELRHDDVREQSCPARPRAMRGPAPARRSTVSQDQQDSFSRTCRITLKRPGK